MGNVSLKVLEKSLNFLFKNGYEPCGGPTADEQNSSKKATVIFHYEKISPSEKRLHKGTLES